MLLEMVVGADAGPVDIVPVVDHVVVVVVVGALVGVAVAEVRLLGR